jgi:heme/copper-type cytochrome/quinol oxidase subunit 2
MASRNLTYYSEIVLVTVLSLVAANGWTKILSTLMDRHCKESLLSEIIIAVIVTFVAVLVLWFVFSWKRSQAIENDKKPKPIG